MPSVKIKDTEPFEIALRRFKRSVEKSGLLKEWRRREFYEKPTTERKRRKAAARKRLLKHLSRERHEGMSRTGNNRRGMLLSSIATTDN